MTSFAKKFICKKAKQVLFAVMIFSLSESVLGETEAQLSICAECLEHSETVKSVKLLEKQICERLLKSPECVKVPKELQVGCDDLLSLRFKFKSVPGETSSCIMSVKDVTAGNTDMMSDLTKATMLPLNLGEYKPALGTKLSFSLARWTTIVIFNNSRQKERVKARRRASERGWDEERISQYADGMAFGRISKGIYNLMKFNDLHCYNRMAATARLCGTFAGALSNGDVVKNPFSNSEHPNSEALNKQFREVQREVSQRMKTLSQASRL